jgi:hypothetical protein
MTARGAGVVGLCAFDSNLNSPDGGWELMGEQLTVFRQALGDPRTAHIDGLYDWRNAPPGVCVDS